MEFPHSGYNIFHMILKIFNEYGIKNKCFSMTFDNASANNAAIEMFLRNFEAPYQHKLFHVKCACHIINLIVQDGMKVISQDPDLDFISNIRSLIKYISTSPKKCQDFRDLCTSYGLKPRKFVYDLPTRWNSTYLMLKSVNGYEVVLKDFYGNEGHIIQEGDFIFAQHFSEFLETFYDATVALSGVYYPTTTIAIDHLFNMSCAFKDARQYDIYTQVCHAMETKFLKYWEPIPPLYYMGSIMDPRKKLSSTIEFLKAISSNFNSPDLFMEADEIMENLNGLYSIYEAKHGSSFASTSSMPPPPTKKTDRASRLYFQATRQIPSAPQPTGSTMRNELTNYLHSPGPQLITMQEQLEFDVLDWWKTKGSVMYPVLSIMAKDLLTPPMSTVASESAFSAGSRVFNEVRNRLKPGILNAIMCLKDWEDQDKRKQRSVVDDLAADFQIANLEAPPDSDDEAY